MLRRTGSLPLGRGTITSSSPCMPGIPRIWKAAALNFPSCVQQEARFQELWRGDGAALIEKVNGIPIPVSKVHFGYVDGIADPTIKGGPEGNIPDHQQPCEPSLFVLLDEAKDYYVPDPPQLGRNGSFGVFTIMGSGCRRFRKLPPISQRHNRPGVIGCEDLRPLAQRSSARSSRPIPIRHPEESSSTS